MKHLLLMVLGSSALVLSAESYAEESMGRVVGVENGDTLTLEIAEGDLLKVRLKEVDAPEARQTFGRQARRFVEETVLGKTVRVRYEHRDQFSRSIAEVILPDGRILNRELVSRGLAWHYRVHFPVDESLRELEYQAWKVNAGLWVDPSAVPPWEYRRENIPPQEPPEHTANVDYDSILSYALIGDPDTKLYRWPDCSSYPRNGGAFVVFGSKEEARASGFRKSPDCPGG